MEQSRNEVIIDQLLDQFSQHRDAILSMIADLEKIKEKVDTIIPETMDRRYTRYFEEKVKSVTDFFSTMLDMRKEITKSLKDEIELRRKIVIKEGSIALDELIDVRSMADKVEQFQKIVDERKKKEYGNIKESKEQEEIEKVVEIGEKRNVNRKTN